MNEKAIIANNRRVNNEYLDRFKKHMLEQGLSERAAHNHVFNVDFFLNEFVNSYRYCSMAKGYMVIDEFFDDWFIESATWASPATIRETAKSIKKFYKFLGAIYKIHDWEYSYLESTIKEKMPHWIELVEMWKLNERRFPAGKYEMNEEDVECQEILRQLDRRR